MLNRYKNVKRGSTLRYLGEATLCSVLIYGFIHLHSQQKIVKVDTFVPSITVAKEPGLYINNRRIPLGELKPGEEYKISYSSIKGKGKENNLIFYLNNPDTTVEVLTGTKRNPTLEARLTGTEKEKEGHDGIALRGVVNPTKYIVKVTKNVKTKTGGTEKKRYYLRITP